MSTSVTHIVPGSTRLRKLSSASLLALACASTPAFAQVAPAPAAAQATEVAAESPGAVGDILVTARKREERLQDVPISIQSFSQDALQKRGIANLEQLSQFTPGLRFQNQGDAFGGRYLSSITFRGMNVTAPTPTNQIGSLFVDGIYVLGGAQSIGLEDMARVEVIKGPQAAYFGRSTFGGAINYITADPANELKGKFAGEYSPSFGSYALSGTVEGPIVRDVLMARITASVRQKGAEYTASDGGQLGRERTEAINGTVLFEPTSRLRVKLRATYSVDDDSSAASTLVSYNALGNCGVGTTVNVLNGAGQRVTAGLTQPYYCGTLPNGLQPDRNTSFITVPALGAYPAINLRDAFVNNIYGNPTFNQVPSLSHFGLRREIQRYSAAIDYTLTDAITLSALGGINDNRVNRIEDADQGPLPSSYAETPSVFKDQSGEARIAYNNHGPLRLLGGVNFYHQTVVGAFANATQVVNAIAIGTALIRNAGLAPNSSNDRVNSRGIFGSIDYDFLRTLTLTLEGRYQHEALTSFGGTVATPIEVGTLSYDRFLPRTILTWKPTHELTVYGSYSQGILPGAFNSAYITLTSAQRLLVDAVIPGIQTTIAPSTLKNYEIGVKQSLWSNRARYSIALYDMDWRNMQSVASSVVASLPNPLFRAIVPGSSRIRGVEFEGSVQATRALGFEATLNYTDAKYVNFPAGALASLFGLTAAGYRADGNRLPRYPEWGGSASVTFAQPISNELSLFSRADLLYQGKMFIDDANLTSIDAVTRVNLRVGVRTEHSWSAEIFANNLFDTSGYVTGIRNFDLTQIPISVSPLGQAALVTPIDKREVGVRFTTAF